MSNGDHYADALHARIDDVEKLLLKLRDADLEAIRVAQASVGETMKGFPGEYARKSDVEQIRETAIRLDKSAMSREAYEAAHAQLESLVSAKLSEDVFDATVREWTVWRKSVDDRIADALKAAAVVAATSAGEQISWKRLGFWLGMAVAIVTLVILLSNNVIQVH
jgi:hypothetical protein